MGARDTDRVVLGSDVGHAWPLKKVKDAPAPEAIVGYDPHFGPDNICFNPASGDGEMSSGNSDFPF